MMYTPEKLTFLAPNEIFVFGSNQAGMHGKGAALVAQRLFGAEYGKGRGLVGQTYAIPTKSRYLKTLPLSAIRVFVDQFLREAESMPHLTFYVTKIGCGLAGYKPDQIAPMFRGHPANVILPREFHELIHDS